MIIVFSCPQMDHLLTWIAITNILKQRPTTVLFEKRIENKREKHLKYYAYTCISLVAVIYFSYIYIGITSLIGTREPIKIVDILSTIGQFATVLTFALALKQYMKNSSENRQIIISNEAKSIISQMIDAIERIETKDKTNLQNLNKEITSLSNLAINFDELFNAMNEDIHKAIVRMQWQNMHFNYLRQKLSELSIEAILKSENQLDDELLETSITRAKLSPTIQNYHSIFEEFFYIKELLNDPYVNEKFKLKGKIASLDIFTYYFLNDNNLDELFYGLMSHVDIRNAAPIFAAAEPADWSLAKKEKSH